MKKRKEKIGKLIMNDVRAAAFQRIAVSPDSGF